MSERRDMATPRIIFVHGMGEKPEPELERRRMWTPLERSIWTPIPYDAFHVAYWADLRLPTSGATVRKPNPALLRSLPVRQRAGLGWAFGGLSAYLTRPDLLLLNVVERARRMVQGIALRVTVQAEAHLRAAFGFLMRDLEPYLAGETRDAILERVIARLDAERGRPLCVISHSMGTMVALDAILHWDGEVDTFITLGAPLGWEHLKGWLGRPAYPANVRHWFNLYDRLDNVAFHDRDINDDYPTAEGGRLIVDRQVRDNYAPNGDRDPHHWHGYLTSPELVDIVCHFWLGASESPGPATDRSETSPAP